MQTRHDHAAELAKISETVAAAHRNKKQLYVFHGSSNTTREIDFEKNAVVDISSLDQILEINQQEDYAVVEPNVSIGSLVAATMAKGLLPPVVMEFPNITVGGGIQGGAGESSSFKHGLFNNCCEEYEIVLGDGSVRNVSRADDPELFYGLACSYGSLAVITKIKLRLIKAAAYVKLEYVQVASVAAAVQAFKQYSSDPHTDFLDAIAFSKTNIVVMRGTLQNEANGVAPLTFSRPADNWFYLHVEHKLNKQDFESDIVPIEEYLFRYNRGAFWVGKFFFSYFKIPFLNYTRRIFDQWLNARSLYRALHATNKSQMFLVQDCCMPAAGVSKFVDRADSEFGAYPLWLCPLAPAQPGEKLSPTSVQTDMVVNVGIYTLTNQSYSDFVASNRTLESAVAELGGRKVLYAHQYYSEDQFWQIYGRQWYDRLRQRCAADTVFPDMYRKTSVAKRYKSSFAKGVLELLRSPDRLIVK